MQLSKKHKPIFSIEAEPPTWGDDSDDLGLESVSEPDLEQDDDEEGAFFSNSPSLAPPSTEDSSSLDPVTPSHLAARRSDNLHEYDPEPEIGLDDEEWVAPSPPPPPSRIASNGLAKDVIPAKENGIAKEKTRIDRSSPSPTPPQHFPFPSSDDGEEPENVRGLTMNVGSLNIGLRGARDRGETRPVPHLRSIRARNGGRTQSGGVKGVWKDGDDF